MRTIGIVLAIAGALALIYGGIDYTSNRNVLELGSLEITTTEHKTFPIPAVVGMVALVAGVVILASGSRRSRSK